MLLGGAPVIGSWANRVAMGLVATSNPTPSKEIVTATFHAKKQFRALTYFELFPQFPNVPKKVVIDPSYTPPFDKSKIKTFLIHLAPIPEAATKYHNGEKSSLSSCIGGQLHPYSSIEIKEEFEIISSTLIKFRAGKETNDIGISDDVGSPVHVPWVWCEHVIAKRGSEYWLFAKGSKFPSHAWYINGKQVAISLQEQLVVSEKEIALSTGRPKNQPRSNANSDESKGTVANHEYALDGIKQLEADITQYIH